MKDRTVPRLLLASMGLALFIHTAGLVTAQPLAPTLETQAPAPPANAVQTETPSVRLSWGVPEILKLARAQLSDEAIIAYISNSGRIYNLSVAEIVYLREQGVSNPVLAAMLNQRSKMADGTARPVPPAPAAPTPLLMSSPDSNAPQAAPATAAPSVAYTPAAPSYVAPVTTYVVPSTTTTYVYPSYNYPSYSYPYYGGYYGYSYPAVSLSFGFGGGYRGGWGHGGGHGWHR